MTGVVGAGSFGTAIANLIALNTDVLIFSRRADFVEEVNNNAAYNGVKLHHRIKATSDPEMLVDRCQLIFPIVPSNAFRSMMQNFAPFLRPNHIVIHGTKGLDLRDITDEQLAAPGLMLNRQQVRTMSEVILEVRHDPQPPGLQVCIITSCSEHRGASVVS